MFFITILLLTVSIIGHTNAWSGVLVAGTGGTQLFSPNNEPHIVNIDIGLPAIEYSDAVILNGIAYFFPGRDNGPAYVYNTQTTTTYRAPPMNTPRYWPSAGTYGNSVIVCGGLQSDQYTAIASCEQFNGNTMQWTNIPPLPLPLHFFATVVRNNRLYVMGGSSADPCST